MKKDKAERLHQNNPKLSEYSQKLSEIRSLFCNGDNKAFAQKLGVSTAYSSALCNAKEPITQRTLEKILKIFPEVSKTWLYFDEGEMLVNSLPTPHQLPTNSLQAPFQTVQPSALPDTTLADENKMLRDNNAALLKHIGLLEDELSRLKLQLSTEREKTKSSSAQTPMEPISA
jgi:hypothetical protein